MYVYMDGCMYVLCGGAIELLFSLFCIVRRCYGWMYRCLSRKTEFCGVNITSLHVSMIFDTCEKKAYSYAFEIYLLYTFFFVYNKAKD